MKYNNLLRRKVLLGLIIIFSVSIFIGYFFTNKNLQNKNNNQLNFSLQLDHKLEQRAKEIFAEKNNIPIESVVVINQTTANFQYSGKRTFDFKLSDINSNITGGLSLDENGQEVDYNEKVNENLNAQKTKYGLMDPAFAEKINTLPQNEPVEVNIRGNPDQIIERLKSMGYEAKQSAIANEVRADLPPYIIQEISIWNDIVSSIYGVTYYHNL